VSLADDYDGVVIGAGHNGLILQAYLARAGLKILMLERSLHVGGGLYTVEDNAHPGFYHNVHAVFLRAITATPWFRDLDLESFGARLVEPEVNVALHLEDGRCFVMHRDAEQTARSLARFSQPDADTFLRRASSWRNLFDSRTGFIEPRLADGSFAPDFDPSRRRGFVEGNAWQYEWMVPHDVGALVAAMAPGGDVVRRLDRFFTRLNAGPASPYAWLGNEPSFGAPWVYLWLGAPWRTQAVVRRALTTLFSARPDGLPGNDDLGAMSSWYVWAALGLYPAIPGLGGLVVGSPLFRRETIVLPDGGALEIRAPAASAAAPYVRNLTLDGRPYPSAWLPLERIAGGARLDFDLSRTLGSTWATGSDAAPPSAGVPREG
jgi:putative alpha-1,2-mannosidase